MYADDMGDHSHHIDEVSSVGSAGGGPGGPSAMDHSTGGRIDRAAGRISLAVKGRVRVPVVVALVGSLVMSVLLIGVGEVITRAGLMGGLRSWDDSVNRWLLVRRTPGWTSFSGFWSKTAETVPIVIGACLLEVVLALRRRWRDLLVVVLGLAVELSVFLTVNAIVRRPRPHVVKLGSEPSTFSFPSGHIAATVVLWGAIVFLLTPSGSKSVTRWLGWCAVTTFALMVGWSRVYRGMHHVTDVTAGALMGLGALLIAIIGARAYALADHSSDELPAPGSARRVFSS